jgi:hypothetical protein
MEDKSMNLEDLERKISEEKNITSEKSMNTDEEIAFHKGSLNTLVNERTELLKIVSNVEKIIGMHISRLKELGVEIK